MNKDTEKLVYVTSFNFREFLLSSLGRSGVLPYQVKCIGFGILLYVIGLVCAFASNTLYITVYLPPTEPNGSPIPKNVGFLDDMHFLVVVIVLGVTLTALITVLNKTDATIKKLNALSTTEENKRFIDFVKKVKTPPKSFFLRADFWYYLDTIGGALIGGALGFYWVTHPNTPWWGIIDQGISAYFFVAACAVVAYVVGAAVFVTVGAVQMITRYCSYCITPKTILPLNPDKVGGLKPLGQFSLELDFVLAIPSLVILSSLVQGVDLKDPTVAGVIILYTVFLVIMFFIPLSAVHNSMLTAKEQARVRTNTMFRDMYSRISEDDKPTDEKTLESLKNLYFLYEKAEKMAVWPLDLGIIIKFTATSTFPIVASVIIDYIIRLVT